MQLVRPFEDKFVPGVIPRSRMLEMRHEFSASRDGLELSQFANLRHTIRRQFGVDSSREIRYVKGHCTAAGFRGPTFHTTLLAVPPVTIC